MSNVIIFPESLSASVFGSEVSGKTPTELYVAVMVKILRAYAISYASNYPHNGDIGGFYFDSINANGEFVQWNPSTAHTTILLFFNCFLIHMKNIKVQEN